MLPQPNSKIFAVFYSTTNMHHKDLHYMPHVFCSTYLPLCLPNDIIMIIFGYCLRTSKMKVTCSKQLEFCFLVFPQ